MSKFKRRPKAVLSANQAAYNILRVSRRFVLLVEGRDGQVRILEGRHEDLRTVASTIAHAAELVDGKLKELADYAKEQKDKKAAQKDPSPAGEQPDGTADWNLRPQDSPKPIQPEPDPAGQTNTSALYPAP